MTYLKASRKRKRERARTQIQRQQKDNSYNKISPNKGESFKCAKLRSVSSESTRACAREPEGERARERVCVLSPGPPAQCSTAWCENVREEAGAESMLNCPPPSCCTLPHRSCSPSNPCLLHGSVRFSRSALRPSPGLACLAGQGPGVFLLG